MDLLHEEALMGMKDQYTVTMVVVAVFTYIVAVSLVLFVDRQRIKPFIVQRLSGMNPLPFFPRNKDSAANNPVKTGEFNRGDHGSEDERRSPFWAAPPFNATTKTKGERESHRDQRHQRARTES